MAGSLRAETRAQAWRTARHPPWRARRMEPCFARCHSRPEKTHRLIPPSNTRLTRKDDDRPTRTFVKSGLDPSGRPDGAPTRTLPTLLLRAIGLFDPQVRHPG